MDMNFLPNDRSLTCYGGCFPKYETEQIYPSTHSKYGGVSSEMVTQYGGLFCEDIFPTTSDNVISKYTGELNVNKNSSIKEANSQLNINMNSNFWNGSSVSSKEHLSNIEKAYLENERNMLISDMNKLKGKVDTKNLAKVASTLSDAAQAKLTRSDARTFGLISGELQRVVDSAKTFNNYSFNEGDKKDLEDKLDANKTLNWLKSDKGQAVCNEIGLNTENLKDIKPDKNGNIIIDGKTIQLSSDKLNVIEKSDKYNTYETSSYTLDEKYRPSDKKDYELETFEKYHTNSKYTNLHAKDLKTGKNLHLPENAQINGRAMKGLLNENQDLIPELEDISGKKIDDFKFLDNHAYYIDDKGVEHQFYYDEKNKNFINANVTPNKEKGGYDVEVKLPKEKETKNEIEEALKTLTDDDKKLLLELVDLIKKLQAGHSSKSEVQSLSQSMNVPYLSPKALLDNYSQQVDGRNSASRGQSNVSVDDIAKSKFEEMKKANPNINDNLLNLALEMCKNN